MTSLIHCLSLYSMSCISHIFDCPVNSGIILYFLYFYGLVNLCGMLLKCYHVYYRTVHISVSAFSFFQVDAIHLHNRLTNIVEDIRLLLCRIRTFFIITVYTG